KKENFKPVNGELFLDKISTFNLTSWNYKGQDKSKFRHYGPMAQDFYAAFGNDGVGTVGCDTLLLTADFMGVNFIAIQALEKRTRELKETQAQLQAKIDEIDMLKAKVDEIEELKAEMEQIKQHFEIRAEK
ncbi:MAG: tail fiber domain-containing protein, partial [Salinivirgaceae bacterium]